MLHRGVDLAQESIAACIRATHEILRQTELGCAPIRPTFLPFAFLHLLHSCDEHVGKLLKGVVYSVNFPFLLLRGLLR